MIFMEFAGNFCNKIKFFFTFYFPFISFFDKLEDRSLLKTP